METQEDEEEAEKKCRETGKNLLQKEQRKLKKKKLKRKDSWCKKNFVYKIRIFFFLVHKMEYYTYTLFTLFPKSSDL